MLLSLQAVIQIVVAFMDWRMGGQIGGESASLIPVSLCFVAILLVFMASGLVNTSSLDAEVEQQAGPREAMYSSLIIMLLTALSLALIVFSKARYVSLSRDEALKLFLGHSAAPSARTEGGSTAAAFLQAPGSARTEDSSVATLRASAQRSSEDSGHGSGRAGSDPPRADVAAPAAATTPAATPPIAPTALLQAPGSARTEDSSVATLRASAQRSSEDSGHGSGRAGSDPPRADVAAPVAATTPASTPPIAPTALVQV